MKFSTGAINKSFVLCAAIAAVLLGAPARANASPFACISGSTSDCALATSTLSWSWDGLDFTITNDGVGYVSEVYFDLGIGMSSSFQGGTGTVNFYQGAAPGSLPGGNSVGFVSDVSFDSDTQRNPHWGLDIGETATFRILGAALDSFDSGALSGGLHVRSLVTSSASLVTSTPTSVPEPATLSLLGFGFVGLAATRRRKQ